MVVASAACSAAALVSESVAANRSRVAAELLQTVTRAYSASNCTYTEHSARTSWRDCSAFALLCSRLCSLASIAGRFTTDLNSPTHCAGHVQEAYGETRTSLLDLASPKPTRGSLAQQTNDPQHYALSPVTRSNRRGVVASTPRAARVLPSRGSAH